MCVCVCVGVNVCMTVDKLGDAGLARPGGARPYHLGAVHAVHGAMPAGSHTVEPHLLGQGCFVRPHRPPLKPPQHGEPLWPKAPLVQHRLDLAAGCMCVCMYVCVCVCVCVCV